MHYPDAIKSDSFKYVPVDIDDLEGNSQYFAGYNITQSRLSRFPFTSCCVAAFLVMTLLVQTSLFDLQLESLFESDLPKSITGQNIFTHLKEFDRIAYAHENKSRSVTNAYPQSAEYVIKRLKTETSCNLNIQFFVIPFWQQLSPPTLSLMSPFKVTYQPDTDFRLMRYGGVSSKLTDVSVIAVDNSGCSLDDFHLFPDGAVALILYDNSKCDVWTGASNAQTSGAAAVLFYNPSTRTTLLNNRVRIVNWTENDPLMNIPVLSVSHSLGQTFLKNSNNRISLETFASVELFETFNVICETKEGDPNNVVMIGAHLDSVPEGPGLVDNASGSSAVLEIFLQIYKTGLNHKLVNRLRFAWWGAEELGLLGSREYCRHLKNNPKEFKKVVIYANHDMLGSPNYVPHVYDGNTAPEGIKMPSLKLQNLYTDYLNMVPPPRIGFNGRFKLEPMTGGSDFFSFLEVGIPSGGVATGAGSSKSTEERHLFGGLANAPYDPCYHKPCDSLENVNMDVLVTLSKAAAHVVQTLCLQRDIRTFLG